MTTIMILGAGVMGSAMALPFADRGSAVRLVGTHLDEDIITAVKARQFHPRLAVTLPAAVRGFRHTEIAEALAEDTDLILLGVSSAGVDWAIDRLCDVMHKPLPILMITKGLQPGSGRLTALPDLVQSELATRRGFSCPVAAIGGPCIAGELAVRRQTGTVIVSRDAAFAARLCAMLETDYYHPRPSADMDGVELCAAFKNFYAIAVGWAHGMLERLPETENKARNNNPASILFDEAIREMRHLVLAHGGTEESVWGMPGAGDLYVTCMAGRNSRLGNNLGRGLTYSQVKQGPMKGDTIEGADLGIAVAGTLRSMIATGTLDGRLLPLTTALLAALTGDVPLEVPWATLHRSAPL
jgi:glycerol-3-phosphate dehydrogenase (NAD(P)+)